MNDKLPKTLFEKQELERQQTIDKIRRAIEDLEAEGCRINIKNLMAYSGLSRSVFAKPHVRTVLVEHVPGFAPNPSCSHKSSNKIKQVIKSKNMKSVFKD